MCDEAPVSLQAQLLRAYFSRNGILLCNESKELPYLEAVGGDWNSVVHLMTSGKVFYSKLYKGRVTYLSREFYYRVKPYRQRLESLSPESQELLSFIQEAGLVNTAEMKQALPLPAKQFAACMDALFRDLFVTVIARDRTIASNWTSFYWGSFERWEALQPTLNVIHEPEELSRFLPFLSEKQIQRYILNPLFPTKNSADTNQ